ncbi:MAG: OmpA family protein [Cyclobacteriaceae bacterium]
MSKLLFVTSLFCLISGIAKAQFFTKLPATINSPKIEYAPSISADGNTMIYQSNKDGRYKLYIAERDGDNWVSKPLNSINSFNSGRSLIAGSSLTYDGNSIFFFANFPGSIGKEDIWYVERNGEDWSDPINAGIAINTSGYEGFPSVSADGNRLYFMRSAKSNPYEGKFCYQLYVSEKNTMGVWQAAVPLPSPINNGCENCPRILPDNRTLLFASIRGEQVLPNYDLFMSTLMIDGSWTEPVPLDFINSSDDELYGTIPAEGSTMYINRKENNNFDLYTLRIPANLRPATTLAIKGSIVDEDTGTPLAANIQVKSQDFPTSVIENNPGNGSYTMVLATGSTYEVTITAPGYEEQQEYLDFRPKTTYELIAKDIKLKKKPSLSVINIRDAKSKQPLQADIAINNEQITAFKNNAYETNLTHGIQYTISIVRAGYESHIDIHTFEPEQFENTLYLNYDLKPLKPELKLEIVEDGERIPLGNSLFLLYDTYTKKVLYQGLLQDGTFDFELESGRLYLYKALAEGYFYTEGQIDLRKLTIGGPFPYKVELIPLKVGERLTLNSINFPSGSAELNNESKQILNNVINVLAQNRNVIVEIAAYTDNVGHMHQNHILSEKRAQSVYNYFLSQQVPETMISWKGYGQHHHIASNHTPEGRAKNRRVEFIVKEVR